MPRQASRFHDFIGQPRIVAQLRRQAAGAKQLGQPFPHTLFLGSSGLGKTQLATALATEFGTTLHRCSGHAPVSDFARAFTGINMHDITFIDEGQAMSVKHQEMLFAVMDEGIIPAWAFARPRRSASEEAPKDVALPKCSIIIATDQPGALTNALRERMALTISLTFYTFQEMGTIIDKMAASMNLLLSSQGRNELAKVVDGVPRRARHELQNLQRHNPNSATRQLCIDEVREYLRSAGYDKNGLREMDVQYLARLGSERPTSLASLARQLGVDQGHVEREIELRLLRRKLITIGVGGRRLTPEGAVLMSHVRNNIDDDSITPNFSNSPREAISHV